MNPTSGREAIRAWSSVGGPTLPACGNWGVFAERLVYVVARSDVGPSYLHFHALLEVRRRRTISLSPARHSSAGLSFLQSVARPTSEASVLNPAQGRARRVLHVSHRAAAALPCLLSPA